MKREIDTLRKFAIAHLTIAHLTIGHLRGNGFETSCKVV
ncbi:hypothetical protein J3A65_001103 [Rhizobium sp. PvP014]|nr:hypothetical protein [Rhizobium sp. PvP014]MBP2527736.1 hypothetical protein [Rhizobium sp. PvP099]